MDTQPPMKVEMSGTTSQIHLDTNNATGIVIKKIAEGAPGEIAGYANFKYTIMISDTKTDTNYINDVPLKVGKGAFSEDTAHNIKKLELKKILLLPQKKLRLSLVGWWSKPHLTIINDTDKEFEREFLFARNMHGYSIETFEKGAYGGKITIQQGWTILTSICIALGVAVVIIALVFIIKNTEVKDATDTEDTQ